MLFVEDAVTGESTMVFQKSTDQQNGGPSTSSFNCGRAMFQSIKKQRVGVSGTTVDGIVEKTIQQVEISPEEEWRRKAAELLKVEAARSKERVSTMGPSGWLKPRLKTNKEFLTRMILSTKTRSPSKKKSKKSDKPEKTHKEHKSGTSSKSDKPHKSHKSHKKHKERKASNPHE